MIIITKENLEQFKDYYHWFHDSTISKVVFDKIKNELILFVDVYWSGEPYVKPDGFYETHPVKMKMLFSDVKEYKENLDSEDYMGYIDEAYMEFITLNKKEYICFAEDKEEPFFYVIAKSCKYEEIK